MLQKIETEIKEKTEKDPLYWIGMQLIRGKEKDLSICCGEEKIEFSQLYAMACRAHRMGEEYEKDTGFFLNLCTCFNSDFMEREYKEYAGRLVFYQEHGIDITYPSPGKRRHRVNGLKGKANCDFSCCDGIVYANGIKVKKSYFGEKEKEAFFWYALREKKCLEHGVLGGDRLYSEFIKYYIADRRRNYKEKNNYHDCYQMRVMDYIANTVAMHNLYFEMGKFMTIDAEHKGKERMWPSFQKDPLLFVLVTADLILSSKLFGDIDLTEDAEKMKVEYTEQKNSIQIYPGEERIQARNYPGYLNKLQEFGRRWNLKISLA